MAVLNLPKEIEIEILSRLPVESLVRFRCVSKPFRSLISDPYFVKLHLNRSKRKIFGSSFPPHSIDYESLLDNNNNSNNAIVELDCPLWSRYTHLSVIGFCNGLICYVVDLFKCILYNPSTRLSKKLPKAPVPIRLYYRGFAFDSSDDDYKVVSGAGHIYYGGFAFDSSDDDYKVVLGAAIIDDASEIESIRFHIFSPRHNSWKRIKDLSRSYYARFFVSRGGIFLNGALHWLQIPRFWGSESSVILSFDLVNEVFSEMSLDSIESGTDLPVYEMGAFEGCLYALSRSRGVNGPWVDMWLMKEYGMKASWTKFITLPYDLNTRLCFFTPLSFLRNGEILFKIESGSGVERELGSYNTQKKRFTRFCNCPCSFKVVLYVESLVSPNNFDGNDKKPQVLGPIAVTLGGLLHSCGKKAVMMMLVWLIFISLFFLL